MKNKSPMQPGLNEPNPKKKYFLWILIPLFFLFGLITLTPLILSTHSGTSWLIQLISRKTDTELSIDSLSLSLWGKQSIQGIRVLHPNKNSLFTCSEIKSDRSFWAIVLFHEFGSCTLTHPELSIRGPAPATACRNAVCGIILETAIGNDKVMQDFDLESLPTEEEHSRMVKDSSSRIMQCGFIPSFQMAIYQDFIPHISGKFDTIDGKVEVISPLADPIFFSEVNSSIHLSKKEDFITAKLDCLTNDGSIQIDGKADHLDSDSPSIVLNAKLSQLPVRGIDQIVSGFAPEFSGLILNTLGQSITMNLHLSFDQKMCEFTWNAQSPQLTGSIALEENNGFISLQKPSEIKVTLTPILIQKASQVIPCLKDIALEEPGTIQFSIKELLLALPGKKIDWSSLTLKGFITASPAISLRVFEEPLVLESLNIALDASKKLLINALAQARTAQTEKTNMILGCQLELSEWFTPAPLGKCSFQMQGLPIALIEKLSKTSVPLVDYIGSTLDCSADIDMGTLNKTVHITANSPILQLPSLDLSIGKTYKLEKPSYLTYHLSPSLFSDSPLNLSSNVPINCSINSLEIPVSLDMDQLEALISLSAKEIPFAPFFANAPYTFTQFNAQLDINTLSKIAFHAKGHPLKIEGLMALSLKDESLTLKSPLTIECVFTDALLNLLYPSSSFALQPTTLAISISPCTLSRHSSTKMDGRASIETLSLKNKTDESKIFLENTAIAFQIDPDKKVGSMNISTQVQDEIITGGIIKIQAAASHLKGLDLNPASIEVGLDAQNISSHLLDMFHNQASVLIGPSFNCTIKAKSTLKEQFASIKATSSLLQLDASLKIDNHALELDNAQINWMLTPEGYLYLDRLTLGITKLPFELTQPTTFNCSFSRLSAPLEPPQSANFLRDRIPCLSSHFVNWLLIGSIKNQEMNLFDRMSQEEIALSNLNLIFSKADPKAPISLNLNTQVASKNATTLSPKTGSLNLKGTIAHLFNEKNEVDLRALFSQIELKITQFPSRILDLLAQIQGITNLPVSTIFGNTVNASLSTSLEHFSGPIALNIHSPNTRASLTGKLTQGGLTLDQSIYIQALMTPEISRLFLSRINPLNISSIYSQDPITLEIPSQNFFFPIYPFDIAQVNIPKARVELGKIRCHNEGNLHITLGLLKSQAFNKTNDLMLWFAPLDLKISQGILDLERTELLLAETFDIAIWGKVDLVNRYVDMILGLTAQSLYQAFGIGGLPENYVLTIPMKGPADDVQINTGKATAKIALLLAWQQKMISGALGGGTAGALVEGLLGKLATLPDQDAKTPPPKRPFPWEVEGGVRKKKTADAPSKKKKHFKNKENPVKQLIKILS